MTMMFDKYDDIDVNPNIIFNNLTFKLTLFSLSKDVLFKNMIQIKEKPNKICFIPIQTYELEHSGNIFDRLIEIFPNKEIIISQSMFIQLYLCLINKQKFRFIRESFESCNVTPNGFLQSTIDSNKNIIYILHINNYKINDIMNHEKCILSYMHLIKIGIIDGYEIFTGLTDEGIKTMTILEWCKYLHITYKIWINEQIKILNVYNDNNDLDLDLDLALVSKNKNAIYDYIKPYQSKSNFDKLKNYMDIGYFDIFEFGNGNTKIAININTNKMVDIK
jgi:hypothetical protein